MNLENLTKFANRFQKNREELTKINTALAKTYKINHFFTECKSVIEKLERLQNQHYRGNYERTEIKGAN